MDITRASNAREAWENKSQNLQDTLDTSMHERLVKIGKQILH